MRLITTNATLADQLTRLIDSYPNMAFAVAWASANTPVFHRLMKARHCIATSVIGTHFYQTHPDVLQAFIGSDQVRFILQPAGVFHPKLYIFWTVKHWEALVGSANLTSGAFSNNSEAVALLGSRDASSEKLKREIHAYIRRCWSIATVATPSTVQAYRSVWERQQPVLRRLGGHYGRTKPRKAPVESSVMSMSWSDFVSAVRSDRYHGFKERCDLLSLVRSAFAKHRAFASMELGLRQTIAGIPTRFDPRWGWFGSMKGVGYFQRAVNTNNAHLSSALDHVPLVGAVTRPQYEAFLAEFVQAFPHGRHGIATASRLLALKRPDQFVCVDSKNRRQLCLNFGIPQTINYEGYWNEIAERIQDSPWWNSSRPGTGEEAMIWDGRAAMLDGIFYRQ
jgi:hypothetical protein